MMSFSSPGVLDARARLPQLRLLLRERAFGALEHACPCIDRPGRDHQYRAEREERDADGLEIGARSYVGLQHEHQLEVGRRVLVRECRACCPRSAALGFTLSGSFDVRTSSTGGPCRAARRIR